VQGANHTVRALLKEFEYDLEVTLKDEPQAEAAVRTTMAKAYMGIGLDEQAEPHLAGALLAVAEEDKEREKEIRALLERCRAAKGK
jgi:hypothetical protein